MKRRKWRIRSTPSRKRWWVTHRLIPLVLMAVALGVFLYVVLQPLFPPRVYLLFASAKYPAALLPTFATASSDLDSLPWQHLQRLGVGAADDPAAGGDPSSIAALDAMLEPLNGSEIRSRDVLLVWLRAQLSISGNGVDLLCSDFDPANPPTGRYPLATLLERVRECPAGTKLILLDPAPLGHAPRLGAFAGCLTQRVREQVRAAQDPNLWVMVSHSELERPLAIDQSHRSAFAHFVGEGLQGAADDNGDRLIDLGELYAYASRQLSEWAVRQSGGSSRQTPVLLHMGSLSPDSARYPWLMPVPPAKLPGELPQAADLAQAASLAPKLSSGAKLASAASRRVAPDGASDAAEETPPTAPEGNARAGTGEGDAAAGGGVSAEVIRAASAEQLWELAAELHGQLAQSRELRPFHDTAHLWRALEYRLANLRSTYLTRSTEDDVSQTDELRRLVVQMNDVVQGRTPPRFRTPDLLVEMAGWSRLWQPRAAASLAMAELIGGADGSPATGEIARGLAASLAVEDRTALDQWLEKLPASFDRYLECRLARRLAARDDLDWPTVRLALNASLAGERAAAETVRCGVWTRPLVERADAVRLAGERHLLSGVRAQDASLVVPLLQRASTEYEQAAAWSREVLAAEWLADEAMYLLPDYLRWMIVGIADPAAPEPAELDRGLRALLPLLQLLDEPSADGLPELRRVRRELEMELRQWRQRIAAGPAALRDAPVVEEVAACDTRIGEPLELANLSRQLRARSRPALAENRARRAAVTAALATHAADPGRRLQRIAALYGQWLHVLLGASSSDRSPARAVELAAAGVGEAVAGEMQLYEACNRLGEALRLFHETLPDEIRQRSSQNEDLRDSSRRADRLRRLRIARRLLYLVHPWDALSVGTVAPSQLLRRAEQYDLLVWQQRRLQIAADDAPAWQRTFLTDAASDYARAAEAIAMQPPVAAIERPLLELESLPTTARADRAGRELPLSVTNHHATAIDVWLMAEYDADQVQATAPEEPTIYDPAGRPLDAVASFGNRLGSMPETLPPAIPGGSVLDPRRPDVGGLPPSLRLQAGEQRRFWLQLRGKTPDSSDVRVILRAISPSDLARLDLAAPLPRRRAVDLSVQGLADTWQLSEDGLTLFPFPNRVTPYRFFLTNATPRERQVDLEIVPAAERATLAAPPGELELADARDYLAEAGAARPVVRLEQISIPPGDRGIAIPLLPMPSAEASDPNPGESPPGSAPSAAAGDDQPTPLTSQLLVVLTDRAAQRQTIIPIRILTQRPARYVRPRVEYDPQLRRAEIVVQAADPASLPADGVSIECEPLGDRSGTRPQAVLMPGAGETRLQMAVDDDRDSAFPIVLHVDGYRRAFRYVLPLDALAPMAVPESTALGVRILEPRPGQAYGPQPSPIEAALEVDVPGGLLLGGENLLEIGIDVNRDRLLDGEESLLVTSDRLVGLFLEELRPDGTFAVRTEVSDLRVTLPPARLKAARVNLLARLTSPRKSAWSEPVEVVFDDQPPRLGPLELSPGSRVVQGGELGVLLLATDGDLSGVAKVEAGFDLQRRGEAPDQPVGGTLQADGRWLVKVPATAAPGVYQLLVRALDRLENASEYQTARVEIVSQEMADRQKSAARRVEGRVVYGRLAKEPVSGVIVRLVAKQPEGPSGERTTGEDGRFVFPAVTPGAYEIVAEGRVRGNPRSQTAAITVPPAPAAVEPVELVLQVGR